MNQQAPVSTAQRDMLANRLRKNLKQLGRWARRAGVQAWRLYDADLPEFALAVDLYHTLDDGLHVVVQEYQAPAHIPEEKTLARRQAGLDVIAEVLQLDTAHLHFKLRQRQKGKAQYEKLAEKGNRHWVEEDGLQFEVNFDDYLDTGLFLDHRITRALLRQAAHGLHCLNLFAYTGTASVHMAAGGAAATTTVDLSRTYLDWAGRNLARNGFDNREQHRLIHNDCLQWLEQGGDGQRYDLVFLDPPSFSTSSRMRRTLDIQRDHVELIGYLRRLLKPGGKLLFSNNLRRFKLDEGALSHWQPENISRQTLPEDYRRNPRIHQAWWLTRPVSTTSPWG